MSKASTADGQEDSGAETPSKAQDEATTTPKEANDAGDKKTTDIGDDYIARRLKGSSMNDAMGVLSDVDTKPDEKEAADNKAATLTKTTSDDAKKNENDDKETKDKVDAADKDKAKAKVAADKTTEVDVKTTQNVGKVADEIVTKLRSATPEEVFKQANDDEASKLEKIGKEPASTDFEGPGEWLKVYRAWSKDYDDLLTDIRERLIKDAPTAAAAANQTEKPATSADATDATETPPDPENKTQMAYQAVLESIDKAAPNSKDTLSADFAEAVEKRKIHISETLWNHVAGLTDFGELYETIKYLTENTQVSRLLYANTPEDQHINKFKEYMKNAKKSGSIVDGNTKAKDGALVNTAEMTGASPPMKSEKLQSASVRDYRLRRMGGETMPRIM